MKDNKEKIIRVYDENGKNVQDVILEAFEQFLKLNLQNNSFSASNKKGNDKICN